MQSLRQQLASVKQRRTAVTATMGLESIDEMDVYDDESKETDEPDQDMSEQRLCPGRHDGDVASDSRFTCVTCRDYWYCSEACRAADQKEHSLFCRPDNLLRALIRHDLKAVEQHMDKLTCRNSGAVLEGLMRLVQHPMYTKLEAVKLLHEHKFGADFDATYGEEGRTFLYLTIKYLGEYLNKLMAWMHDEMAMKQLEAESLRVHEYLCDHATRADLPTQDCEPTPLFFAVAAGRLELAERLLKRGASLWIGIHTPRLISGSIQRSSHVDSIQRTNRVTLFTARFNTLWNSGGPSAVANEPSLLTLLRMGIDQASLDKSRSRSWPFLLYALLIGDSASVRRLVLNEPEIFQGTDPRVLYLVLDWALAEAKRQDVLDALLPLQLPCECSASDHPLAVTLADTTGVFFLPLWSSDGVGYTMINDAIQGVQPAKMDKNTSFPLDRLLCHIGQQNWDPSDAKVRERVQQLASQGHCCVASRFHEIAEHHSMLSSDLWLGMRNFALALTVLVSTSCFGGGHGDCTRIILSYDLRIDIQRQCSGSAGMASDRLLVGAQASLSDDQINAAVDI